MNWTLQLFSFGFSSKRWGTMWEVLSKILRFPYSEQETGVIMTEWNVEEVIRKYSPSVNDIEQPTPEIVSKRTEAISCEDIQESYELMASIVTEHGETFLPIFSRLHDELKNHIAKRNLLSTAFKISNEMDNQRDH